MKKNACTAFAMMTVFVILTCLLPALPLRAGVAYDAYEVEKFKTFLNITNSSGVSYAQHLGVDANDPATWDFVTWTYDRGVYKMCELDIVDYTHWDNGGKLDLSGFDKLITASIRGIGIELLDVSDCANLEFIDCYFNEIHTLNTTGCKNLKTLWCERNKLAALDVSARTSLYTLACNENEITALTLGYAPLGDLYCNANKLTSLDLKNQTDLKALRCSGNRLTELSLFSIQLTHLECANNQLASLDIKRCYFLEIMRAQGNQFESLDDIGWPDSQINPYEYYYTIDGFDYFQKKCATPSCTVRIKMVGAGEVEVGGSANRLELTPYTWPWRSNTFLGWSDCDGLPMPVYDGKGYGGYDAYFVSPAALSRRIVSLTANFSIPRGDINGDDVIDIEDLLAVIDHIFEIKPLKGNGLLAAQAVAAGGAIDIEVMLALIDIIFA